MFLRGKLTSSFGHMAAAVAMFLVAGGHWGAMQTVAWTGMLWNYTQADGSLLAGVKKTFDGEHPCTMCKSIKVAKEKERTVPVVVSAAKKIEAVSSPLCTASPPRSSAEFVYTVCFEMNPGERAEAPPVPVPIADLV